MISLEGLTLATGRTNEAGWILRTFAHYIRDGLIPNLFPEGREGGPLPHRRRHALVLPCHCTATWSSPATAPRSSCCCRSCVDIVDHHMRGTRFGIGVDPADGLLRQGQQGYQLTWMDAKVGDWVVTPRRGKAVEINALWYNALRLLERWLREEAVGEARARQQLARSPARVRESFNRRFWFAEGGYLYDVVDAEGGGNDDCLPPQPGDGHFAGLSRCSTSRAGSR